MKFYHGTSKKNWKKIQDEGVLWGVRNAPNRCTYLTSMKKEAEHYGDVVLEINYNPREGENNWVKGCWQHREYFPIPLSKVKLITF